MADLLRLDIDYYSSQPVYQQIVDQIKEAVLSGSLEAEESLPSIRELARNQNINPNTVARAYRELENKGYIYSRPGIGSFICAKSSHAKRQHAAALIEQKMTTIVETAWRYKLSREDLQHIFHDVLVKVYGGD
ncbi:MAG TPA: GntR family transcriptional regulator [Syntrophomonadaceae bacterium]|nr:GntR family transcriptional regulator [Syntrophomonadaceae bacterium]